jgi:DNA-binding SARP family transcriptional activator/Tfp pilus assembly protein PilF
MTRNARPAPASIEIRLLGSFRVAIDGEQLPDSRWRQRKAALLLQRLALEPGQRLHSEQLMEALWPDAGADAARNSLHKTIHLVRSALEPDLPRPADSHFLLTRGQQVVLSAPERVRIDVADFLSAAQDRNLDTAVALYEGPLLPEEPYEEWIAQRREQLHATYVRLLADLARAHEDRHEHDRAIEVLQRLVSCEPTNETAHRALMRVYAASGRRQLALRQYDECAGALRRDLDAEPEPATIQLFEEIASGRIPSVAVLPFANVTGNADLDYLSDGMTESVIATLARQSQLNVLARSTVASHKAHDADPRRIAQSLNAAAVVTGTILQRHDRVLVRAELVDATSGARRWGAEYDVNTAGVPDEIAEAVARAVGGAYDSTAPPVRQRQESSEAWRLVLRGRHLFNKRTLDWVTRSIDYFRQAIDIDPEYAPAWVGLSDAYAKLGDVGVAATPPREAFSKAKIAAIRGIEIDSSLAEAHTSLAHLYMHEYEWAEAEREFLTAIRLNPRDVLTRQWFSFQKLITGRIREAFEEMDRALRLEPLSVPANADYGDLFYYTGDHAAAVEQHQKTIELDAHYYPARLIVSRALTELGRYDEALAELETAKALGGERPELFAAIACVEARAGRRDAAHSLLSRVNRMASSEYVSPYSIATVHAALGETDQALAYLRQACDEHAAWTIFVGVDPRLAPLREHAAFASILERVGLAVRA